ncbi:hypothetical protein OG689_23435 [Kitasatospora sp. NBC_00240]|uniref:hypothetical protein n=1 Tax=Kitasatospora sp. NBC_00240 TaxID=2903567 RepID=UPI0022506BA9|nr:hypothetical protein [Kitasatospora sp. NBC_00240]MCX5212198.1 hypothetical protein [Kitasatospora sp. NBC_00240]
MSTDHDRPDPQFELDFTRALSRAGEDYAVRAEPLIAGAQVRGRRLRRRRTASVAASIAALAVIGAGGVFVAGPGVGGAGPATAPPVSAEEFTALLTGSLPAGTVQVAQAQGTQDGTAQVRLILDDGGGAAQVIFWVTRAPDAGPGPECPTPLVAGDECAVETLPDGSSVALYKSGTRADEPAGARTWSALLYTADGFRMQLQEWNRDPQQRGAPITRADPPLTQAQLTALVTDRKWQSVKAALEPEPLVGMPEPDGVSPPTGPRRPRTPSEGAIIVPPTAGTPQGGPAPGAPVLGAPTPVPGP